MKSIIAIITTFFLTTCTSNVQNLDDDTPVENGKAGTYVTAKITLVGDAQQAALSWNDYQSFITELENYDHSKKATDRMTELVDNMSNTIPASLVEQPVSSRLVVLQSKLGTYKSAVRNTEMSKKEKVRRYNEFILALDQFHVQLNEKLNYQAKIDELLNTLKADFDQPLDSIPTQE